MSANINIRDAVPGKTYLTSRGYRIKVMSVRPDTDDVEVLSLASGGHVVVVGGGTPVLPDGVDSSGVDVVVDKDDNTSAPFRIRRLVSRILQESTLGMQDIASITPYDYDTITAELNALVQ